MIRYLVVALALVPTLAGCGKSPQPPPADAGKCVPAGAEIYCTADSDCCQDAFCDPFTQFCRANNLCGVDGAYCSGSHPCCQGVLCESGSCYAAASPSGTGGPTGASCLGAGALCMAQTDCCSGVCFQQYCQGGSPTGGSGSTGSCSGPAQACNLNSDCCSNVCATGNHLCAAAGPSGDTSAAGSGAGGSSSGTGGCGVSGMGCSSPTDCCSNTCNGQICG